MKRVTFLHPSGLVRWAGRPATLLLAGTVLLSGPIATLYAQAPATPPAAEAPASAADSAAPVTDPAKQSARDLAQDYLENDEARKAVAVLTEAARANPKDRVIGSMLYGAIRDHVWHISQTLPITLDSTARALAFNSDGTSLASGADSGLIVVMPTEPLDAEDAKTKRVEFKMNGAIIGVYFSTDGKRLAAASAVDGVKIWNLETKAVVFEGPKPTAAVTAFHKTRKAQLLAIGMADGSIQVVDLANGKVVSEPKGATAKITELTLSTDGTRIGAASDDKTARVWETAAGKAIGKPLKRPAAITAVDFNYDARYLLVAGGKEAVLLDPDAGVAVMPAMACGTLVKKAKVSPDGSRIATMQDDGSILFWDAFTGKKLGVDVREDGDFNDFIWGPAGMRVVTVSKDNHASIWSSEDGIRCGETLPHDAPVVAAVYRFEGMFLATSSEDGKVRIWRTDGGKGMPTVRSHPARARAAFYSLDGEHLVTTSEDHTALHWLSGGVRPTGKPMKHKGKVVCATFSKDATRILTCDDTGIAQLWVTETLQPDGAPFQHKEPVAWVDYHPDGKRVVTASGGNAFVWNISDHKKPVATIVHPGAKNTIKSARFSPDGKLLVTGSTDGTARIWDAATYKPVGQPIQRGFPVLCARFSPDSTRLVVAGEDGQAVVYDTTTWKTVGQPIMFPGPVFSAAMTEDNRFLVAAAFLVNNIQFFEIETGRPLGIGPAVPSQATCIDHHIPDKVVTIACDDGTVRAFGSPFVGQDTPPWVADFAERLIGFRKTGPETFEHIDSHFGQLQNYASTAATAANFDFPRLVRWKMTMGTERTGAPRFVSTIAQNIERRVEERSLEALFECYEAAPADTLVLAALSRFLPDSRRSEFLADVVVADKRSTPLAWIYAAGALINAGRSAEGIALMKKSIDAAPNDVRVLRREAKLNARLMNKAASIEQFEKALVLDPNDFETRRSYGWALYNLNEPKKAAEQFRLAQDLTGDLDPDVVAGLCVSASAIRNNGEAHAAFRKLVSIDASWKEASYIASLAGWTRRELRTLEGIRGALYPAGR